MAFDESDKVIEAKCFTGRRSGETTTGEQKENVINFPKPDSDELSKEDILKMCADVCNNGMVVLGYDDDGELFLAWSLADEAEVNYIIDVAKLELLK